MYVAITVLSLRPVSYTCGNERRDGFHGMLGHGNTFSLSTPKLVEGLFGVKQVHVGSKHVAVLIEAGKVYTFGNGGDGQLGHGDKQEERRVPTLVRALETVDINLETSLQRL